MKPLERNIKNWIFSRNQLKHMRPPSHYLCVWYWHCTIPGRQPPLYTHICELRNFARLKISTFHHMSSSQAGQVSQSLLWVSCKLTPSDLSRVYHVSHSGMIYPNWHCVYFWTNLIKRFNLCSGLGLHHQQAPGVLVLPVPGSKTYSPH